jgi:hypothetical protein
MNISIRLPVLRTVAEFRSLASPSLMRAVMPYLSVLQRVLVPSMLATAAFLLSFRSTQAIGVDGILKPPTRIAIGCHEA